MSVSSLGAAVPAAYEETVSASDGGSVDSLFIADIHERREDKRRQLEAEETDSDEGDRGIINDLLRHFRHCCASRKKGRYAPAAAATAAASAPSAAAAAAASTLAAATKGPTRAQTYSVSGSSSSSSSSSSSAARSTFVDRYMSDLAHVVQWRILLGAPGAPGALGGPPSLTTNQAAWAACRWCACIENNEKMCSKMLSYLLLAAEQQKAAVDISHAIKETPDFKCILFSRKL